MVRPLFYKHFDFLGTAAPLMWRGMPHAVVGKSNNGLCSCVVSVLPYRLCHLLATRKPFARIMKSSGDDKGHSVLWRRRMRRRRGPKIAFPRRIKWAVWGAPELEPA